MLMMNAVLELVPAGEGEYPVTGPFQRAREMDIGVPNERHAAKNCVEDNSSEPRPIPGALDLLSMQH